MDETGGSVIFYLSTILICCLETTGSCNGSSFHNPANRTFQLGPKFNNRLVNYTEGSPIDVFLKRAATNQARKNPKRDARKRASRWYRFTKSLICSSSGVLPW